MKNIVIVLAIIAAAYYGWYKNEAAVVVVKPSYSEKSSLHKCQDDLGNITYSDKACVDSSDQDLNIVVPVADKASAERLKALQLNNQNTTRPDGKVSLVRSNKTDKVRSNNSTCQRYQDKIKSLQNAMRSGYSGQEGDSMKKSMRDYKNRYNNECK